MIWAAAEERRADVKMEEASETSFGVGKVKKQEGVKHSGDKQSIIAEANSQRYQ